MIKFTFKPVTFMILILLTACGLGSDEQQQNISVEDLSPITVAELEGTEWILTSYGSASNPQIVLEDTEITVRFNNLIDMGGSTGCNSYGRHFEIDAFELIVDELQRTRFSCPERTIRVQENAVITALETVELIGLMGDDLVITYNGGRLHFVQKPPPLITPLTDTQWQLVQLVLDEQEHLLLEGTSITAEFREGVMSGASGCNSYGAEYELEGTSFSIGELSQTAQLCQDDTLMDQERAFISVLQNATVYLIEDELLTIGDSENSLHFQRLDSSAGVPLRGVSWRLMAVIERGQRNLPVEGADITILFDGSQYSGWTGCNQYSGNYTISGHTIQMDSPFVTQKECPNQSASRQEREFLAILNDNPTLQFSINQNELVLEYDGGELLFSTGNDSRSEPEGLPIAEGVQIYENPYLDVWLTFPAHWERDPEYFRPQTGARFFAEDGHFLLFVMSLQK